jgi:putative redox protein
VEMLVEYEGGMRFRASTDGFTIVAGKGADGDASRDNMGPGKLFLASLGMCVGVYVAGYCNNHGIPCDDLRVEIDRETAHAPSRTTQVAMRISLGAELTEAQRRAILAVARQCHVHQSIERGMEVTTSLAETAVAAR